MGLPFVFRATAAGLKDMGSADESIGAYLADSVVAMRGWAAVNGEILVRYIKAVVEGRRWVLNPANKTQATRLLAHKVNVPLDIAAKSYAAISDPNSGYAKDAKLDMSGFKNVLKLRAELEGQWGGTLPSPEKYIDLSYYNKAIANI